MTAPFDVWLPIPYVRRRAIEHNIANEDVSIHPYHLPLEASAADFAPGPRVTGRQLAAIQTPVRYTGGEPDCYVSDDVVYAHIERTECKRAARELAWYATHPGAEPGVTPPPQRAPVEPPGPASNRDEPLRPPAPVIQPGSGAAPGAAPGAAGGSEPPPLPVRPKRPARRKRRRRQRAVPSYVQARIKKQGWYFDSGRSPEQNRQDRKGE